MSGYRLSSGGAVNRDCPIAFAFNGKTYHGFEGDTLASALIASGVDIVGRSFKYHRPRGFLAAGVEEPNGIVQVGSGEQSTPNLKATTLPLYDGLTARSVNAWPSADFDIGAVNDVLHRFLPAGFYYKTFMWPDWRFFEPVIRRAAGLGTAPMTPDGDAYEKRRLHCDLLIIGGGPAGLSAALAAAQSGLDVVLADDQPSLGGSLLRCDREESRSFLEDVVNRLSAAPNVTVLYNTSVFGYYDHNQIAAREWLKTPAAKGGVVAERLWKVSAAQVVLASGAAERPLMFPNNDRPGVMLASAVQEYAVRYGVAAGRRAVLLTNNDCAYEAALAFHSAGGNVELIVDLRADAAGELPSRARAAGISVQAGCAVEDVRGGRRVRAVKLVPAPQSGSEHRWVDCDLLMHSAGWAPRVQLFAQSGGGLTYDERIQAFRPGASVQNVVAVGGANGAFAIKACLEEGRRAAVQVCEALGAVISPPAMVAFDDDVSMAPPAPVFRNQIFPDAQKTWVDFQNDVTVADIELAARENYRSVEHLKRYTTLGMATDQGKTSNLNGFSVMAGQRNVAVDAVGTTKFRPPYEPVSFGALAGQNTGEFYHPLRQLPTAAWQRANGADFDDWGGWARPNCYPRGGETHEQAIQREALAVRNRVGLFEASPLGKIEVAGPDAGKFLDRIFVNTASTLKPGRARYGVMANEHGVVIDDGVFVRLSENVFLCSTTSGGAERIAAWMEEWLQCEWIDLRVFTANVTSSWAAFALAGPKARDVLAKVCDDVDLSREAFPHMSFRSGAVCGAPARIYRVSFTGELAYEVNIPARCAMSVWRSLMQAGEEFGVTPYGVEANLLLRAEKGYLHVGAETDGATLPQDIGFGGPVQKKKADFIGRRSMLTKEASRRDRLHYVGLKADKPETVLPIGAHVIEEEGGARRSAGFVSSSYFSPTLKCGIALARVKAGRDRMGERVRLFDKGVHYTADIVSPVFYDPEGARLNG